MKRRKRRARQTDFFAPSLRSVSGLVKRREESDHGGITKALGEGEVVDVGREEKGGREGKLEFQLPSFRSEADFLFLLRRDPFSSFLQGYLA